ncbi:MAG TPA: RuBisCO large subunit C-terminal-like domain-containing protein, partial [Burkholderiaceae bacterium]|nr:RuBisCO large subunit C-terminal-like domain-containing protein [Burkholderiaceae bacterium]
EQSIEMPLEALPDERLAERVVAQVLSVDAQPDGCFHARLALAPETVGDEPGQFMNMLFGNCSLQPDVELIDVQLPADLAACWGGPHQGIAGLRERTGADGRALTCSAIKPIGLDPDALAGLCRTMAQAVVKDDHGLANQHSAPFEARVRACQAAVQEGNARRPAQLAGQTLYAPSLYGHYGQMREQLMLARSLGVQAVLIAPVLCGVSTFVALKKEFDDLLFIAHPALGGLRMSAEVLFGKLFRLFGADATIFTNHGGRFALSRSACLTLVKHARQPWHGLKPSMPTPAGGMRIERVAQMLDDYGPDCMLLIGGDVLLAKEALLARCRAFVAAVSGEGAAT